MTIASNRSLRLAAEIRAFIEEASGIECPASADEATFFELGLDSLLLTQIATKVSKKYGIKVAFRQLLEEHTSVTALVRLIDSALPAEVEPISAPPVVAAAAPAAPAPRASVPALPLSSDVASLVAAQLDLMRLQLELMQGGVALGSSASAASLPRPSQTASATPEGPSDATVPESELLQTGKDRALYDAKKAFGAAARISHQDADGATAAQRQAFDAFVARYNAKTKSSKTKTQENRATLADPRVVTGFRPLTKEIVYPLFVAKSKGSRLWDIDGNEYVDALCGFGSNFFGYEAGFINDAIRKQLDEGFELGPQHPLATDVAALVCELTGHERAALCNTGSEAVMGAMRIARTVTGRSLIAVFAGSYHGIFDEVIVRGSKKLRTIPAAPGILPEAVENVLVLDYGTDETLAILRERADQLAAVLVEPVQSRRADFQPREFLHEVRTITQASGSALIFDEVITGFRAGPGGAQAFFGVRADIATYGKVVGGGMPVGIIAGQREWMDALDGGDWRFGDASKPEVGVTYFAGTFVRHPLTLAATKAALVHMKEQGPALQDGVTALTRRFAEQMNEYCKAVDLPLEFKQFASLWKATFAREVPFGDVLFCWLRDKGVHIWDGFPCFFTTAHTQADVDFIAKAFKDSIYEMQTAGLLPGAPERRGFDGGSVPVPGARLGKDQNGFPAWFVADPARPGKFIRVGDVQ
jgi:glutamate-1-semialdehyde aminotransferase/acyl carrier protein